MSAKGNLMNGLKRRPADALNNLMRLRWTDLAGDLGQHLTCSEADALAAFLWAFGNREAAESLLEHHCMSDDDDDLESHVLYRDELIKPT